MSFEIAAIVTEFHEICNHFLTSYALPLSPFPLLPAHSNYL